MKNQLGSVRQNKLLAWGFAAAIAIWTVLNLVQFHRSSTVDATIEASEKQPALPMFGAEFTPGNIVEITVAKSDLGHLQGFVTFCGYAQPIAVMVVLLFGLLFLYRFTVDVLTGQPFTKRANSNLLMVGVAVVAYPIVPGIFGRLGTNSVIGALDLDTFDSASSAVGVWTAIGIAFFLQIVFAAMQQGARLAEDTQGLV
ncbi:hypothetical protein HQ346_17055 [Rhodococcus sp. BP-252]|uniref:DUF2975 domain-containing protein n=1 Tax=Rhodococcoides kyotonense TaxID=398843 RepID=A0A177Y7M7_9NOCA|nr:MULTISPECIES: hypothetical protein [Rhodococcus]MBY6413406.1 hypothetical protein [Rhodococcus sp. BP-320]MBY6418100.1 hypothetical protein [Rhodococcus sp. BP-321]MBY6422419.1 hypothetical protein [Rhodococcus sp. BP-324]MBY6426389.1 hypothetical protein [Rhodococcus sp. BP-323]MBY6431388.1 hypothetical protein [Rhodococcus sp. BP-322]